MSFVCFIDLILFDFWNEMMVDDEMVDGGRWDEILGEMRWW